MESYEKKYKETLERAKKLQETCNSTVVVGWCEYIFPELKESEDEKIRKEIIRYLKRRLEISSSIPAAIGSWIAWLEKQGEHKETLCDKCKKEQPSNSCQDITALGRCAVEHEQKTADKVYIPMSLDEAIEHCKKKSCDNTPCALEHKQLGKWLTELNELKEQKPAWSEEDEVKLQTCIDRLQAESLMGKVDTVMTNWLKSLKERINGKQ